MLRVAASLGGGEGISHEPVGWGVVDGGSGGGGGGKGSVDEAAWDVAGADGRGVSNGDLCAVYAGAVSAAVVRALSSSSSKGDSGGLYARGGSGMVGTYDGGGCGGPMKSLLSRQVMGL